MLKYFHLFVLFGSTALFRRCYAFSASPTPTTTSSLGSNIFKEIDIQPVSGGTKISLEEYLKTGGKSLFVFGTYAADFNGMYIYGNLYKVLRGPNWPDKARHGRRAPKTQTLPNENTFFFSLAIEYAQRLRYYLPVLKNECGVEKFGIILNCQPEAALALADVVDLDTTEVDLFVDNTGDAGKIFGVGRGWLPDNEDINPFLKLFGMLWGKNYEKVGSQKFIFVYFH